MPAVWGDITAEEIATPISGRWISGKLQTILGGVSTDSRKIGAGEVFWALKGNRYDGHDFVENAVNSGASGVVVEAGFRYTIPKNKTPFVISVKDSLKALGDFAAWWRQQHRPKVIAITGSVGKTTTKEMAACILELGGATLKNPGNYNNLIGLPLTLLSLEQGHQRVVLEMGMNQPGEIARLTEIADPDVGVITNVGMAHIEGLGNLESVARAKAELVEKLSQKATAVLNGDDPLLLKTASIFRKEMVSFGLGKRNDVRGQRVRNMGREGIGYDLQYQGVSRWVNVRVPGLQNVHNSLAAATACLCLKEPFEHIVEGLGRFAGIKGRFMVITLAEGITLVDDTYNANPQSLKAALQSVKALINGRSRIIVGLGEMLELGDATVSAHEDAGRWIAELGTYYFVAMGEHAHVMTRGAEQAGMSKMHTEVVKTHAGMVKKIEEKMKAGDLVFLKGSRRMALENVVEELKGRKPQEGGSYDHIQEESAGSG
jgi:UDP-N-acetylmuramoyl-tripeptide--D-alanyl-D-alanine ligase